MKMKLLVSAMLLSGSWLAGVQTAQAIDEDDCGIWLCLPQGFPSGCAPHYAAYIARITHKPKPKPPLPQFSSCTTGDASGQYFKEGYVPYIPCKAGYTFSPGDRDDPAKCSKQVRDSKGDHKTESYNAIPRAHPYYVQVWIDGKPTTHYGVGPTSSKDWHIEGNTFWYRR